MAMIFFMAKSEQRNKMFYKDDDDKLLYYVLWVFGHNRAQLGYWVISIESAARD